MAKISTYERDNSISREDLLTGSNFVSLNTYNTKNFKLANLVDFFAGQISVNASTITLKANGGLVRETISGTEQLAVDLGASSITGQLANNDLANSSITINGVAISLGGSVTTPDTQLTDAQVRSKISVTGGGASYNSSTGVITLPSQFTLAQNNVTNASVSGQTLTLTRQSASDITFTPTANDFTDADHTKLDGIAAGAEVNVQANWTEATSTSDAFIQNKPTLLQLGTTSTTALAGNTTTISSAQSTKLGHISVTQAVDLDTIESDTATNNAKTSFPGFGTTSGTALEGDTSLFSGAYADLTGKPTIPSGNQIIDWTIDQGSTNIHTGNYNNTQLTDAQVRSKISGTGLISYNSTTGVISTTANNYTLPTASSSTLGGVKVGSNLTIDGSGVLNVGAIALTTVQTAANESAHLALTAQEGDIVVRSDQNKSYVHNGGSAGNMNDYTLLLTPTDAVLSVTTTDGSYINLTPNSATTGAINIAADLSAADGTSDTSTRFLSKDNTWDVPSYTANTDINVNVANLTARMPQITESFTVGDANDVDVTFAGIVTTDKTFVAKGQNVSHGTSQIKISQENTTKSQIRFYGADTSTAGILEFTGSSSDGSVGGVRFTINADGSSTFAGDVTLGDTSSDHRSLSIQTNSEKNSIINLKEGSNLYGFSLGYYGVANDFIIKRHDNSASGTDVLTLNRDDNNATFAGSVTANTGSKITSSSADTTFSIETTSGTTIFPVLDFVSSHSSAGARIRVSGTDVISIDKSQNSTFAGDVIIPEYIKHSGDTDTYIRVLPDEWIFRTGGSDRLTISNSNTYFTNTNVGINETSPRTKLEIKVDTSSRNTVTRALTLNANGAGLQPYEPFGTGIIFEGFDYAGGGGTSTSRDYAYIDARIETSGSTPVDFTSRLVFATNSGGTSTTTPTTKMVITGQGNVGIGETNPLSDLTVRSDSSGGRGGEISIVNYAANAVGNEAALNFGLENSTYQADLGNAQIKARVNNGSNAATDMIFSLWNGSAFGEKMRVDSSGNVGITAAASFRFNGTGDNTHAVGYDSTVDGSFLRGQNGMRFLTGTGGGSEKMRITSDGMIGIGMTPSTTGSSTYMLQMYNSGSQCFLSIGNGTSGNGPTNGLIIGNDAGNAYVLNREATPLKFYTNDIQRMLITSGGDVAIAGASDNNAQLTVNTTQQYGISVKQNKANATEDFSDVLFLQNTNQGNANRCKIGFSTNGTDGQHHRASIGAVRNTSANYNGNIIFEHRQSDGTHLDKFLFKYNGEFHADGDVVAFSTTISDQRLKDNIITIDSALDKVKKLRGVRYVWNNGSKKGKKDLGVIAQEVEEILPEIVTEKEMKFFGEKKYKTVDYEKLTAVLIEAVKELSNKVKALENGITK